MFDDKLFEEWLDKKGAEVLGKLGSEQPIRAEEMMVLVLKAQANHFIHLDSDLRSEIQAFREDADRRFEAVERRFEAVDRRFEEVERRFEAIDRRFEAVDRRFEEVREDMNRRFGEVREDINKRFEAVDRRFASTQWLIGIGFTLLVSLMSVYQFLQ